MVSSFKNSLNEIKNLKEIYSLGLEENNQEILKDCEKKLIEIGKEVKKNEISCFLSKQDDHLDIYLEDNVPF